MCRSPFRQLGARRTGDPQRLHDAVADGRGDLRENLRLHHPQLGRPGRRLRGDAQHPVPQPRRFGVRRRCPHRPPAATDRGPSPRTPWATSRVVFATALVSAPNGCGSRSSGPGTRPSASTPVRAGPGHRFRTTGPARRTSRSPSPPHAPPPAPGGRGRFPAAPVRGPQPRAVGSRSSVTGGPPSLPPMCDMRPRVGVAGLHRRIGRRRVPPAHLPARPR